ncbi:MAG: DUF3868 domain-containing protein [Muribaculaceae bacterium]|nr:DUF3868 domain-containing protein [Muribaculaceae bacterium]
MKTAKLTLISALIFGSALGAAADSKTAKVDPKLGVESFDLRKDGDRLLLNMTLDAAKLRMSTNREMVYTPMIVNGTDTLRMRPFAVAGKNRFYSHVRGDKNTIEPVAYRAGQIKEPIVYKEDFPYAKWMEDAKVEMEAQERGCCSKYGPAFYVPVAQIDLVPRSYTADVIYVTPKAEAIKERQINARAYIDFPVNKIEIYPDYRRNPQELKKILATIDSVRADENLTFKSIHIKGYASPEGTYANNERLAKGRTQTLADYVRNLYKFKSNVITTSYTPEDWAGLEEYVKSEAGKRNLTNAEGILAIITDPAYRGKDDARELAIKTKFPKDYQFLLAEVYPGLRHSDYAVNFTVRSYQTPEEISKIMKTAPQNLSLSELFVLAKSLEPGSKEYNETFDLAVQLYPNDPVANLNAGNAALMRGDLEAAAKYLAKAGDSTEAQYARATLAAMEKDYAKANQILSGLRQLPQAQAAEKQIKNITDNAGKHYKLLNTEI